MNEFFQPQFVACLSSLLADTNQDTVARQAAGIQLKNCLVAKTSAVKQVYQERWFALEEQIRNNVKSQVCFFSDLFFITCLIIIIFISFSFFFFLMVSKVYYWIYYIF